MAQSEEQKLQASLFDELNKSDIKVTGEDAKQMKDDILNDRGGNSYLGLGVHEVYIEKVSLVKANSGTLGIRMDLANPDGQSDVTFWVSEKALPYSIKNISSLVVHNTGEAKKEDARNFMANITSAKELFEVAQKKLIDGTGYLQIKESKTQTYTDTKTGEVKPSIERNLTSWKPKEEPTQTATKVMGGGETVDVDRADLPF